MKQYFTWIILFIPLSPKQIPLTITHGGASVQGTKWKIAKAQIFFGTEEALKITPSYQICCLFITLIFITFISNFLDKEAIFTKVSYL